MIASCLIFNLLLQAGIEKIWDYLRIHNRLLQMGVMDCFTLKMFFVVEVASTLLFFQCSCADI